MAVNQRGKDNRLFYPGHGQGEAVSAFCPACGRKLAELRVNPDGTTVVAIRCRCGETAELGAVPETIGDPHAVLVIY